MDLQDFKNNEAYWTSSQVGGLLYKLDLNDPGVNVVDSQSSIPSLMQGYMACQAQTNEELIRFMGQQISQPLNIGGVEQSGESIYKIISVFKMSRLENLPH